jgi:tetratricopeptide (TPR) repeat protein
MTDRPTFRQLLLSILARYYDVSQKQLAVRAGLSEQSVSQYLGSRKRQREMKDQTFEPLLGAIRCRPAAVLIVTRDIEDLDALETNAGLTDEELLAIEDGVREVSRLAREVLTAAVRRSRPAPASGGDALDLCLRLCDESERAASRDIESAALLARLAAEAAAEVDGPEGLRTRIRGLAAAHGANVLRVAGELPAAETAFEEARRLWAAGADPEGVFDPGRMLDLEGSLRRDQRRFDEALARLEEAVKVGRAPERALVKKGFTLEVMGEYERAVEALLLAEPLMDRTADPHLWCNLHLNLAVNYTHLGLYREAERLVKEAQPLAVELGADLVGFRITWLTGRITAGLGQPGDALQLLAEARREFARRKMVADAALALLEEAALLLDENRTAEVKALAGELTEVLESKGLHREALAALQLFKDAAERETATAELARSVLRFLFRARHDQGLRFTGS